jgi:hypothetical protein
MSSEAPPPLDNPAESADDSSSVNRSSSPPPPPPVPTPVVPSSDSSSAKEPKWLYVALPLVGAIDVFLLIVVSMQRQGGRMEVGAQDFGYSLGYVVGGMLFLPLLVVALFSISKRFRNVRNGSLILFFMWVLTGLLNLMQLGTFPKKGPSRHYSEANKVLELGKRMNESEDLNETAKMGDEVLNMISNLGGAGELTKLKEWVAFQKGFSEYNHASAQLFQSSEDWFSDAISSKEKIDARIGRLNELAGLNKQNEENYLQLMDKAAELRDKGSLSQRRFFQGFTSSMERQRLLQQEVRQCEGGMLEALVGILTIYREEWGKWSEDEEGTVVFESEAATEKYNKHLKDILVFSEKQAAAQKTILEEGQKKLDQLK